MITSKPRRIMAATVSTMLLVMSPMFATTSVFAAQSARTSRISVPPVVSGWVRVSTAAQLEYIDHHQGQYLTRNIELMSNITLPDTSSKNNWTCLGSGVGIFSGILNGDGHEISGVQIHNTTYQDVGFIGELTGKVEDLRLNVTVNDTRTGTSVGGLVGTLDKGSISNSYVTGTVSGVRVGLKSKLYVQGLVDYGGLVGSQFGGGITNSYTTGAITVTGRRGTYNGGLVGYQYSGSITNSHADETVTGVGAGENGGLVGGQSVGGSVTDSYALGMVTGVVGGQGQGGNVTNNGGLVGGQGGNVTDSYATGAVMGGGYNSSNGGLVGIEDGTLSNSYATGTVTGKNDVHDGGLVGIQTEYGSITDSYAIGAVTGGNGSYNGGLVGVRLKGKNITASFFDSQTTRLTIGVGYGSKNGVTGESTSAMKTERTFSSAPHYTHPWNFETTWGINPHINKGYPYLKFFLTRKK